MPMTNQAHLRRRSSRWRPISHRFRRSECDGSFFDHIEAIGKFTLVEYGFASSKLFSHRACGKEIEVVWVKAAEKWMGSQPIAHGGRAVGRIRAHSQRINARRQYVRIFEFEQIPPCRLQTVDQHLSHSVPQFVSEVGVVFTGNHQTGPIEEDSACRSEGAGLEMPRERGKHPRPAENVATDQELDGNIFTTGDVRFKGYLALDQEKESIGGFILVKKNLAFFEFNVARMPCQHIQIFRPQSLEKRMFDHAVSQTVAGFK